MTRALLIEEPPLLVLPSLVREVGLPSAIVLQQMHFLGGRTVDGWIVRSIAEWMIALKGCLSRRTIERALETLRDGGWVEAEQRPGEPTRYRVDPRRFGVTTHADLAGGPTPNQEGSVLKREEQREKKKTSSSKKPVKLADEVAGFAEWMGYHVTTAEKFEVSLSVPGPETMSRTDLHKRFAALAEEGRSLEEMKLASLGVLSSEWHRTEGHTKLITVLRQPEKLQERIDAGRAAEARADVDGGKYGHLDA